MGDGGAGVVEDVDGDVHGLLIGGEEEVAGCGECLTGIAATFHGVDQTSVGGGQSRGGVEAPAASGEGEADGVGILGTVVGGEDHHFGDVPCQRGVEVEVVGVGDGDRLGGGEGLSDAASGVSCGGGTGEGEDIACDIAAADDHHGVAAHGQVALEVAEGGIGGCVVAHLCHQVLLGAVGGVEGQRDGLDAGIVGHILDVLGSREPFQLDGEVVDVDADFGGAGVVVLAAGREEEANGCKNDDACFCDNSFNIKHNFEF